MMMASDIGRCLDPVRLARDCGIEPDPWQARLLCDRPRRALMLCCRQSGKTEVAIQLGLWTALYEAGSLVIIVSPSQRQSGEVFRRLMLAYSGLDGVPELRSESALRAELVTGSRIIALPGSEKTTRCYSRVKLAIVDEAARVDDSLMAAVRPMLATVDGSLIMLSTPNGQRGEFYRAWTEGGDTWTRIEVPASDCPRLTESFLREERAQLGDALYRQEYELEILSDTEAVFDVNLFKDALRRGRGMEAFF
jgi:hypothetical protein